MGGFFSRINPSIVRILLKEKPDVIILHGYVTFSDWIVFILAKLLRIRIIFKGEAVLKGNEQSKNWKQRLKRFLLPKFLNKCDCVLYSCTGNKEYWKFFGVEDKKMFPLPCAVDNDFFQNERKKYNVKEIKKELGIKENDLVILFSARFTERKRPLDLLESLVEIENQNIVVIFVGNGTEKQNLKNFAKKHNIRTIFTGFVGQTSISKFYSVSDIDIVISEYDPSPKAMNEAMNFKLPIIVTNVVGTAKDLVKDDINGFIVSVGDIKAISQKIDYLNNNRDVAKKMGKQSFKIINDWTFKEDAFWINKAVDFVHRKNEQ